MSWPHLPFRLQQVCEDVRSDPLDTIVAVGLDDPACQQDEALRMVGDVSENASGFPEAVVAPLSLGRGPLIASLGWCLMVQ
ncbi:MULTISPECIES: hypothetical protein [Roseobacteraceae]|uniref:Uncharacterized protein n=1 Tax=Tropicimonas aquimaris TaxID=914152 RepID=A0ABW3IK54_9RHOB|nr:hypothetical protein [Aliiruegeria sabulilitoris]